MFQREHGRVHIKVVNTEAQRARLFRDVLPKMGCLYTASEVPDSQASAPHTPMSRKAADVGVLFPSDATGKRSSLAGGKAVWEAAARAVDPALADAIANENNLSLIHI